MIGLGDGLFRIEKVAQNLGKTFADVIIMGLEVLQGIFFADAESMIVAGGLVHFGNDVVADLNAAAVLVSPGLSVRPGVEAELIG